MAEIRLLLVEDHEVVRTGIRMLLERQPDIEIVGEASNGAMALELSESLQPNVIIMDITLPDISGIKATRLLKERHPEIAIVALTIHESEQYLFEMLEAGVSGYVPKRAASEDLIKAIRAAHQGEVYLYPSMAKVLVADFLGQPASTPQQPEPIPEITPREQEVLQMLAQGHSNKEISEALSISKHTVARHRENLMRKLDLHSRSDLVKFAIRRGLIKP